jgi:hypothetical protein
LPSVACCSRRERTSAAFLVKSFSLFQELHICIRRHPRHPFLLRRWPGVVDPDLTKESEFVQASTSEDYEPAQRYPSGTMRTLSRTFRFRPCACTGRDICGFGDGASHRNPTVCSEVVIFCSPARRKGGANPYCGSPGHRQNHQSFSRLPSVGRATRSNAYQPAKSARVYVVGHTGR